MNWESNKNYRHARDVIRGLKVVNDVAERGVKLMEEYNIGFTKKEDQKQYLLKVCFNWRY